MHNQKCENWNDSMHKRNRQFCHWNACKVCHYKRYDKFERLHFANLALAHEPDYDQNEQVNYNGSEKHYTHENNSAQKAPFYTSFVPPLYRTGGSCNHTFIHLFSKKSPNKNLDVTLDTIKNLVLAFLLENLNESVAIRFQTINCYLSCIKN